MSQKVAILVHGGGQGPWSFDRVKSKLEAQGTFSQILVPSLPTTNSTTHGMSDDIAVVATAVQEILPTASSIVLVGHSMGATTAAAALEKLSEAELKKIKSLIMVAGVVIPAGVCAADFGEPAPYLEVGDKKQTFKKELIPTLMYNDKGKTDPELESYMAKNGFSSQGLFDQRTPWFPYTAERSAIPLVYIMTTEDQVCAPSYQDMFVAGMPKEQTTVVKLAADHMVVLTDADKVVEEIVKVAGA